MLVPVEGSLAVIKRVAEADEEAARVLVEIAMFEALHELAEDARPILEADMDAFIEKSARARRALVRSFVEKRMAGEDVEDVVKAAAHLTLLEEEVSKAPTPDNPQTAYWDAREKGRFAPRNLMRVLTGEGMRTNPYAGQGDKWAQASASQRLAAGGQILAQSNDPNAQSVGMAAQFIGEVGPEANKVLGSHIRRTAYRYRGTERKPDAQRIKLVHDAGAGAKQLKGPAGEQVEAQVRNALAKPGTPPIPMAVAGAYLNDLHDMSPDQLTMALRGDVVAAELIKELPTMTSARISREAGRTAPSVGIMIDADGDVVSEAQGFHGDHYVPFDLKNLKRLSGGQYVRTRTMGGPTGEDIYTGLLANARQMQVISNSGVFTVEFDPSIRGKKRYNDKAAQMVGRYNELLAAIGSGKLVQRQLPLQRRQELRQQALRLSSDQKTANDKFNELVRQEIEEANFLRSDEDIEDASLKQALTEINGTPDMKGVNRNVNVRAGEIAREMRKERQNEEAKIFQLDGEGYAAALDALQEEFPFYIRSIRHEALPEFVDRRKLHNRRTDARVRANSGKDIGYQAAGMLNLTESMKSTPDKPADKVTESTDTPGGGGGDKAATAIPAAVMDTKHDLVKNVPMAKNTKLLQLDLAKSPELTEQAAKSIRDVTATAALIYDAEDEAAGKQGLGGFANDDKKTVAWLTKNKTPEKFLAGIKTEEGKEALKIISEWSEGKTGANVPGDQGTVQAFKANSKSLLKLADLAEPFAPFSGDFSKLPDKDTPKPLAIPQIVRLGNKLDNYTAFEEAAKTNQRLTNFIAAYEGYKDNGEAYNNTKLAIDRIKTNVEHYKSGDQDRINNIPQAIFNDIKAEATNPGSSDLTQQVKERQTAWAFVHARRLATENKDILGVYGNGGTDPKAEAPAQGADPTKPVGKADRVSKAEDLQALAQQVHPHSPIGRLLSRQLALAE